MSFLKPDYDYVPLQQLYGSSDIKEEIAPSKIFYSKTELSKSIENFCKEVSDAALTRFYSNVHLSVKTNTNVFDSVAFYKKFSDAFFYSLKTNFSHLSEDKLKEIEESFENTKKILDESLKGCNVENKFLLFLSLGLVNGMLGFENY